MKWVKVAIGAVIAILSIGIIATSVYSMTQETVKNEVVIFEVLTESTVTSGTYNQLLQYSDYDDTGFGAIIVDNILSIKINGNIDGDSILYYEPSTPTFNIYNTDLDDNDYIADDDSYQLITGNIDIADTVSITFEVTQPPQLTGITATLILLTPLIFAGGVLAYLLNKQEL